MEKINSLIESFYKLPYSLLTRLPLNFVSKLVGKFADHGISKRLIPFFVKKFDIYIEEAEKNIKEYPTLNSFFTRRLKQGARKFDPSDGKIISPADGVFSYSKITNGKIWVIKNKGYSLAKLIGLAEADLFHEGHAVTIYLSPRDYHRFHIPVDGEIVAPQKKINGFLFSVLPAVMNQIDDLFCVNERLIYSFKNKEFGYFYVVAVGATFVGSIVNMLETSGGKPGCSLKKGDELGAFKFGGSSIVLVAEKSFPIQLGQKGRKDGDSIKFGETL